MSPEMDKLMSFLWSATEYVDGVLADELEKFFAGQPNILLDQYPRVTKVLEEEILRVAARKS